MRPKRSRWVEHVGLPEDEPAVDADVAWIRYQAERESGRTRSPLERSDHSAADRRTDTSWWRGLLRRVSRR
jgi:hypothetical protein